MDTFATMRTYAQSEIDAAERTLAAGCPMAVRAACHATIARNRAILARVPESSEPVPAWVARAMTSTLPPKSFR